MSATVRPAPRFEITVPVTTEVLTNVYVWEWPVRIAHWLNALSIWILSVTGLYLGGPFLIAAGPASGHFLMGWAKLIHFYAAIVFGLAVLSRIAWLFLGNKYARWDKWLPVRRVRRKAVWPTIRYYLFALRLPPGFVGHNPLAGLTYGLLYLTFLVQIGTGLAMYAASAQDSWLAGFEVLVPLFGGLQTAHLIHHVTMWLIWCFIVHHIYSAVLMSLVEPTATVESIFSGHKFVPPEDIVYSGYRFEPERRQYLD